MGRVNAKGMWGGEEKGKMTFSDPGATRNLTNDKNPTPLYD